MIQQAVEAAAVHQVSADEAGEGERALHHLLGGLGEAQQQEGDRAPGVTGIAWAAVMSLTLAAVIAA